MKIFVAYYNYIPAKVPESFATYKLFRNSKHEYYIVRALPLRMPASEKTDIISEKNVHTIDIRTDCADEWVQFAQKKFDDLNRTIDFDALMTIGYPSKSILVAKYICENYPSIKWISSVNEPISNNPNDLRVVLNDNTELSKKEKEELKDILRLNDELIPNAVESKVRGMQHLRDCKKIEEYVIDNAHYIISPTASLFKYMIGNDHWLPKFRVIPYGFDSQFCKREKRTDTSNQKIEFIYINYSGRSISLTPFIRAIRALKERESPVLDKIHITVIGDFLEDTKHMVLNYYLDDYFSFVEDSIYYDSLKLLQSADWALYTDSEFDFAEQGGSVLINPVISDYIGSDIPIFAITETTTPAYDLVVEAGGVICNPVEINNISLAIEKIVSKEPAIERNEMVIDSLNAHVVAAKFDGIVDEMCGTKYVTKRFKWPALPQSVNEKVLTVCVPSYNAQQYLDRCILSLINHEMAPYLEVLVINDGSKDFTSNIAKEYEDRYPDIVRLIDKENGGHGSAINAAIKEAKGEFFKNVDSDDWVDSENLAKLIQYLMLNKDIDAVSSDYDEIDLETGVSTPKCAGNTIQYEKIYNFAEIDPDSVYFTIHSLTIKTRILKDMGITLQNNTFFVDCEYILFPVPFIKNFVFLADHVYKYSRGNPKQSVDITNMVRRYDHHDRVIKRCIKYRKQIKMSKEQQAYYDSVLKRLLFTHFALSLVYDQDTSRGLSRAKEFYQYLDKYNSNLANWAIQNIGFIAVPFSNNFESKEGRIQNDNQKQGLLVKSKNKIVRIAKAIRYI